MTEPRVPEQQPAPQQPAPQQSAPSGRGGRAATVARIVAGCLLVALVVGLGLLAERAWSAEPGSPSGAVARVLS